MIVLVFILLYMVGGCIAVIYAFFMRQLDGAIVQLLISIMTLFVRAFVRGRYGGGRWRLDSSAMDSLSDVP
jgi:hypothetical protein